MKRRNVLIVVTLLGVAAVLGFMRLRGEGPAWLTGKPAGAGGGGGGLLGDLGSDADEQAVAARQILGRVWFDKLPTGRTTPVTIALWLGGGIGLYEEGSSYRFTIDVFDFERRGQKLDMTFLHDKRKVTVGYTVAKCEDEPPFDVCLTFDGDAPRGPKKLYGFGDQDDAANRFAWFRDTRHDAMELARQAGASVETR
jgi:hypothetical protein